jgi:hypothetical protein
LLLHAIHLRIADRGPAIDETDVQFRSLTLLHQGPFDQSITIFLKWLGVRKIRAVSPNQRIGAQEAAALNEAPLASGERNLIPRVALALIARDCAPPNSAHARRSSAEASEPLESNLLTG